jgi:putative copper resistance protein D
MAQAGEMTGVEADAFNANTVWAVATDTYFGHVWLTRLVFILAALGAAVSAPRNRLGWATQTAIGAAVAASLAWMGHGAADAGGGGLLHLVADLLHLLAAGAWLGALVPLTILLNSANRNSDAAKVGAAEFALTHFSGIGPFIVALLILTGLVNSWFLVSPAHVFDLGRSPYGVALIVKLLLFGGMLALAGANRFVLGPRLSAARVAHDGERSAINVLRRSVLTETALAALVLVAVALLGTLAPPVSGE